MSEHIDDGGPAFPVPGLEQHEEFNGMTLRDYFAAKAMYAALIGSTGVGGISVTKRKAIWDQIAALSYETADAMLAARKV